MKSFHWLTLLMSNIFYEILLFINIDIRTTWQILKVGN